MDRSGGHEDFVLSGYQRVERAPTDSSMPVFEVYVPIKTEL